MTVFNQLPTRYSEGTASVAANATTVTGTGTNWTILQPGDLFGVHKGLAIPIASISSDGLTITLAYPWPGAAQTNAAYCVQLVPRSVGVQEAIRQLLLMLANGNLDAFAALDALGDQLPIFTGPGVLSLIDKSMLISGADYDVQVNTFADRAMYDGSQAGYRVLVSDVGNGRSAIYSKKTNTSADWSNPAYVTGATGAGGPYTEITIGTVTTLPYGSSATINVVPIDADTIRLDFGIPAGQNGTGTGDFVGPSSSVDNEILLLSGTTGKLGKRGPLLSTLGSGQNEAILALEIADLKGSRLGMKGGVADPFDDESGVDIKTNATYDAMNDWYKPGIDDANVLSLLHLDGSNGSISIFDETSLRSWSITGSGAISTAQSKFGGASLALTGGYASTPAANDLKFGTGDFTIELWVRFNSAANGTIIVDMRAPSTEPVIYVTGGVFVYYSGSVRITGTTAAAANTWYHLALVRSSGVTRMYVNGTKEGADYTDPTSYSTTGAFRLGTGSSGEGALNGFFDEVRISKSARYTSNFTPQTTAFQLLAANMTLVSVAYPLASMPTEARLTVQTVEFENVTPNTDFVAEFSRDGGTTWTAGNLSLSSYLVVGSYKMYETAPFSVSGQPSGSSMKWRLRTLTNKNIAMSGVVSQGN